jgi:hypothetical protein
MSHEPLQVPVHSPLTSTEQLPEQLPEQPPEHWPSHWTDTSPPEHSASTSQPALASQLAWASTATLTLAEHLGGSYLTVSPPSTLALISASISALTAATMSSRPIPSTSTSNTAASSATWASKSPEMVAVALPSVPTALKKPSSRASPEIVASPISTSPQGPHSSSAASHEIIVPSAVSMNTARTKLFTLVISVSSLVLTFASKVGFRAPGPGSGSRFVFVGEFQAYILSFKAPIKQHDQPILIAAERPGNRNLPRGRAREYTRCRY